MEKQCTYIEPYIININQCKCDGKVKQINCVMNIIYSLAVLEMEKLPFRYSMLYRLFNAAIRAFNYYFINRIKNIIIDQELDTILN